MKQCTWLNHSDPTAQASSVVSSWSTGSPWVPSSLIFLYAEYCLFCCHTKGQTSIPLWDVPSKIHTGVTGCSRSMLDWDPVFSQYHKSPIDFHVLEKRKLTHLFWSLAFFLLILMQKNDCFKEAFHVQKIDEILWDAVFTSDTVLSRSMRCFFSQYDKQGQRRTEIVIQARSLTPSQPPCSCRPPDR